MAQVFKVDSVVLRDFMAQVGQEWDLKFAQTTLLACSFGPGVVSEVRVH